MYFAFFMKIKFLQNAYFTACITCIPNQILYFIYIAVNNVRVSVVKLYNFIKL